MYSFIVVPLIFFLDLTILPSHTSDLNYILIWKATILNLLKFVETASSLY